MAPVHLRTACVDLDGNIIGTGRMIHPPDDNGYFPAQQSNQLRLSRQLGIQFGLYVAPCRATRDPSSGFLTTEEFGSELNIPEPLALVIMQRLRLGTSERIEMSLWHQNGNLASSTNRSAGYRQLLSEWILEISESAGSVTIKISAALQASRPIEQWMTKARIGNFWTTQDATAPRLQIEMTIDLATRVACFGTGVEGLTHEKLSEFAQPTSTSIERLDIEQAPVGPSCAFGFHQKRWLDFYHNEDALALTWMGPQRRSTTGFIRHDGNYLWPRIWMHGVKLEMVADTMGGKQPVSRLTMSDGVFGELQDHPIRFEGYNPHPIQLIVEATLDFALTTRGLAFSYRCLVNDLDLSSLPYRPGWIDGNATLPWELLIFRHPQFLRHRSRVPRALRAD
jgi:hypothetical protein